MALKVVSFATYLTRPPYTGADHDALKFVKAVKGKSFRGWATVPILGRSERLDNTNAEQAVDWFGELAAAELQRRHLKPPVILIPVPNSSCTVKTSARPRTARLAEAVAIRLKGAKVWDRLRWKKEMTPTHQGSTRDPQRLYDTLSVTTRTAPEGTLVLVDDVHTLGGHAQACVARLADISAKCKLAVCAGRTVLEAEQDPFSVFVHELEDFVPKGRESVTK